MLEVLQFIFANPLHFFGVFFLLALPCGAIANIGRKSNCPYADNCEKLKKKKHET